MRKSRSSGSVGERRGNDPLYPDFLFSPNRTPKNSSINELYYGIAKNCLSRVPRLSSATNKIS